MSLRATLPPDRGSVQTEQRHPQSMNLDALDTQSYIDLMIDDHKVVLSAITESRDALAAFIDELVPRMRSGGRLIYIGAGTSGRLGVLDAAECPPTFQSDPEQVIGIIAGGDASLRKSSESKEDDPEGARQALQDLSLNENDTLLGIAAGSTTPYVLGAIEIAKSLGAQTGFLTCSPIAKPQAACDHLIFLNTGPEILTGSTRLKAGSATKLALNIISTAAFTKLGKVYSNLMVDLRATNAKLTDRTIRILVELCPELSRESAAELLTRAEGNLKAAIVMQRLDVDFSLALQLLEEHDGHLRAILNA